LGDSDCGYRLLVQLTWYIYRRINKYESAEAILKEIQDKQGKQFEKLETLIRQQNAAPFSSCGRK
jgi:hypothetical protein